MLSVLMGRLVKFMGILLVPSGGRSVRKASVGN
jgi:hypothetical protein